MNNNKNKWDGINRRKKGNDWLIEIINVFTVFSWIIFFAGLLISHYGRPEASTILIKFYDIPIREHWIPELKQWFLFTLVACTSFSMTVLIANKYRLKRKGDHLRLSPIIISAISILVFVNITML